MNQSTQSYLDEQVKLVFQALPISLIGTLLSLLVLGWFLQGVVPDSHLAWWIGGFLLVTAFRGGLYLVYRKIQHPEPVTWARWFSLGALLAGCSWGGLSLWLYPLESMPHQILIAFAIAGVMAAGTVSLAALWQSFLVFMPPIILPLMYQLSFLPDNINIAMIIIAGIFSLFMINSARHSNLNIRQNIMLRQKSLQSEKTILASQLKLKESQQMLSWILDTIPVSVYWKDRGGVYLGCNKVFADELQLTQDSIIGHTDAELPAHGKERLCSCNEQRVLENGLPLLHQEQCVALSNGKLRWLDCNILPLTDNDGKTIGVLGASMDITGQKRIEEIKNEFISTVSHELRTPLTSIRGAVGLLNAGNIKPDTDQFGSLMSIAHNNTERLLHLIDDLLTIQKIESNYVDFIFEPIKLSELVRQVIHDNASLAHQYDVRFILEQDDEDAWIMADAKRITQVVANLISNAAKFSHPGQQIEIGLGHETGHCYLYVQDHGVGIPQSFHNKLFDRFTQWDASNTRQVGGTGLGLNIVKSIVERHQGEVLFQSEEGVGTRFEIRLPAYQKQDSLEPAF